MYICVYVYVYVCVCLYIRVVNEDIFQSIHNLSNKYH